ncbi:MAG: electron transfer flavoprotein subunit alpha/FixB family protein [Beutenbergiaceae bacterium]
MSQNGPVLVVALSEVRSPVLEAVTIARELADPVVLALAAVSAAELASLADAGVSTVLTADLADGRLVPSVAARAVAAAAEHAGADVVLFPSSFFAKEVAAHSAHALHAGLLIDVAWLAREQATGELVGGKRTFAGTWDSSCAVTAQRAVVTVRPNAVTATSAPVGGEPVVTELSVEAQLPAGLDLVSRDVHPAVGARPALAEAAVVVAGGRGTEGDFAAVEQLADALGAAVGTTRDCVDEGWQPHDAQIGQTGITIAPRLYIGAGISGAPHHHGGMQASGTIVAVNLDPDAPLVQIADYAVIGDLHQVLADAARAITRHRS